LNGAMSLAEELGRVVQSFCAEMKERNFTIAVAESCTGGLLCSSLTSSPECGAPLEQGFVTYTKASKIRALGLDAELLDKYGVISVETAKAMADAARMMASADIGIGITGVAGPDRAEEKPVGLVHIGCSFQFYSAVRTFQFDEGPRDAIRHRASIEALKLAQSILS
jgi:PncC family amidohydrolase